MNRQRHRRRNAKLDNVSPAFSGRQVAIEGAEPGATVDVEVKRLKDIAELEPDGGAIVNAGAAAGGVIFPPAPAPGSEGGQKPGGGKGGREGDGGSGGGTNRSSRTQSVLPPMDAREQLAFDAVREALRLDPPQVADLRKKRGVGADMLDELRQCYEMKMSSSADFPPEVTLTRVRGRPSPKRLGLLSRPCRGA